MKKTYIIVLLIVSGILGFVASYYSHRYINPTSSAPDVPVIQTFHYPATFVNQLKHDPDAGRKIFKEFCATCHDKKPLIDIRAPRIGDKAAWKVRRKMGMPALLNITIIGVGAMPSRGGCFECSDQQLRETIQYILNHSN
jgi:cytochrome c5